ncbi:MAG: glycosyltransferase [Gemmatimonadota bacterium]
MTTSTSGHNLRPRVGFLARNLVIGGAERAYLNLVNETTRLDAMPILLRNRGQLAGSIASHLHLHVLDDVNGLQPRADLLEAIPLGSFGLLARECLRLARIVDEHGIELVSSFLMRSHIVALLVKKWLRPQLRVVINIHEHLTESEPYLYVRRRDRLAARTIARSLFRSADHIVAVGDEVRRDLISNFLLPEELVSTVHNPIDLEQIRRLGSAASPIPGDSPYICALGRLVYLKGYDDLIRAFSMLRSIRPMRLVLIGDGEERPVLEALVTSLGLDDSVVFMGWQGNPWSMLARSAALAVTSRTEAFPSVITEALALGVPVVAVECSAGIRESLDGGNAGLLVPSGDRDELAAALERALGDRGAMKEMRDYGLRHVERFALQRAVSAYEDLIFQVMGRSPLSSWGADQDQRGRRAAPGTNTPRPAASARPATSSA